MNPRWKPSVTVAGVIEHDGRYLLVEEQTRAGLRLNNPAGHLEPGESLIQAVVREVLEETAYAFEPQHLLGVYLSRQRNNAGEDASYLRLAFTGRLGPHDPGRPLDAGIVRAVWLTADEIRAARAQHRSPLVMRGIEDHLAGLRYPLAALVTDASVFGSMP